MNKYPSLRRPLRPEHESRNSEKLPVALMTVGLAFMATIIVGLNVS